MRHRVSYRQEKEKEEEEEEEEEGHAGRVTCRKVLAPGARVLNCTDSMGKRIMLRTAAVEYQKDPATPF